MEYDVAYKNFLSSFIHEGIFVIDEPKQHTNRESIASEAEPEYGTVDVQPEDYLKCNATSDLLVVLNQATDDVIKPDLHDRFANLLKAIQRDFESIAVLNIHGMENTDPQPLIASENFTKVIAFDSAHVVPNASKRPDFEIYQNGHQQLLLAPSIEDIFANKQLAYNLWACLQQLFPEAGK